MVYDSGTVFEPSVLDITMTDLRSKLLAGVARVASISLAIKYPTVASAPHMLANAFKNLMAVAAVTDVQFEQAKKASSQIFEALTINDKRGGLCS
jgi:large subunit ribosomal protein LP0